MSVDGYCRAHGAGVVVLKTLEDAVKDGDHIRGVIAGIVTNQGGISSSITVPDPAAQKALYRSVLKQAGVRNDRVTYVVAYGTGTQVSDPLIMESIVSVFGGLSVTNSGRQRSVPLHVGPIRGEIGHCEPAAGVVGLLKLLAMLTLSHTQP